MQTRWTRYLRRALARSGRRTIAGLMVGCYALVLFGFPMAPPALEGAIGGPFPCQDHACGCGSASQCWRSCCCFSDEQKRVWAEANGVTPPADFLQRFAAKQRLPQPRQTMRGGVAGESGCCHAGAAEGGLGLRCGAEADGGAAEKRDEETQASSRLVITVEALKCRGVGSQWTGLAPCVLLAPAAPRQVERLVTLDASAAGIRLPDLSFPPPSPPPRA